MSTIIDEVHFRHNDNRTGSPRADQSERHHTKTSHKSKTLRLDSPTTIEACKDLGILVADLKQKTIDEFKESGMEEDIMQLRYNHYLKRYTQNIKDVMARKRELTRNLQRNHRQRNSGIERNLSGARSFNMIGATDRSITAPHTMKNGNMSQATLLPAPMFSNYTKTMHYLKASHDTAEVRQITDIIGDEFSLNGSDDAVDNFDRALAKEVTKFNKLKRQKQKEAKDAFEDDVKRVLMVEEMKEREKKLKEREKKLAVEKKKNLEEKRRQAEDKLDKIREAEERYRNHKLGEKEKIQKRLEETKKKLNEEAEERKKYIAEHEEKLERKKKYAEERREQLKIEEQLKCDQLKVEIESKLCQSQEKYGQTINNKASRVKLQVQKIEENLHRTRGVQEQTEEEHVQKLVEKLVKKEEATRAFHQQKLKELKKREKEAAEKNRRFFDRQSDLEHKQEERMREINERFQKVQENLAVKREQEEKELKLKQELTRLKLLDKQDNYARKQRQVQHERQKVLDREKYNQEKLHWLKNQREVLQQAKVEVSIQSKIEKQRIENSMQHLSKLIKEKTGAQTINEQQKKILKEILQPEDYKRIEDEEKRKLEAKREAEELKKAGMLGQIPVKAH